MTKTPTEIPKQLLGHGFRFTRIKPVTIGDRSTGKSPRDRDYYDSGCYPEDSPRLLKYIRRGFGYGLVCNYGDLAVLDADKLNRLQELEIMDRLPPMLSDEATPESRHYFFICPGLDKRIVLYDPELTEEIPVKDKDGNVTGTETVRVHLGEVQAGRSHIIGPNSPHWSGARRKIVDNSQLPTIAPEELKETILKGLAFTRKIKKEKPRKPAALVRKARKFPTDKNIGDQINILDIIPEWSYNEVSGDNLKGDPLDHSSDSGTAFSINPTKNVWHCHNCNTGGGPLELYALKTGRIRCGDAKSRCIDTKMFKEIVAELRERGILPPDPVEVAVAYFEERKGTIKEDPNLLADEDNLEKLADIKARNPLKYLNTLKTLCVQSDRKKELNKLVDNIITGRKETVKGDKETDESNEDNENEFDGFNINDFCITKEDKKENEEFIFSRELTTNSIRDRMELAMEKDGRDIHWFDGKIYRDTGGVRVSDILYTVVGDLVKKIEVREVLDRLKSRLLTNPVKFNQKPFLMPLENGILDLETGKLREYKAEDLFTFKYNAKWDPEGGDWKHFLWSLCTMLPDPNDVLTALDIVVAVALRVPMSVIVHMIGGGSNGKGVFEKVLLALFTTERATALQLDELKRSRFGPGALFNTDLWIISEVEGVHDSINGLKKISTGEFTDSDQKYAGRIKGRPHAVPILDSNSAFDFGDDSYGRKRRVVKLDFPHTFGCGEGMRPEDPHLEEILTRPECMSGLVRIIAARAPELIKTRKVFGYKSTDEADEAYKRQRYSLAYFTDECLGNSLAEGEPAGRRFVQDIYREYEEYCRLFKVPTPAPSAVMGKYISEKFGLDSTPTTVTIDGKRKSVRYYNGIYVTKKPAEAFADFLINYSVAASAKSPITTITPLTTARLLEISLIEYEIDISRYGDYKTTVTTDNFIISLMVEIAKIYAYIWTSDVSSLLYESYVKNSVVGVVTVVSDRCLSVSVTTDPKCPVVNDPPAVANSDNRPDAAGFNGGGADLNGEVTLVAGQIDQSIPEPAESGPHVPITEVLEAAKKREAEYLEHIKTPTISVGVAGEEEDHKTEPDSSPPAEESDDGLKSRDEIIEEATSIAEGLMAQGLSVTFENIKGYLETKAGKAAPSEAVERVMDVLRTAGWSTDTNGVMSPPPEGGA